jgi:hypothetical protein
MTRKPGRVHHQRQKQIARTGEKPPTADTAMLKRIILKLVLRPKLLGQFAAAIAASAAGVLASLVPGLPGFVVQIATVAFQLPEGTELNQMTIAAVLTPLFLAVINAIVAELLRKDNNKVLEDLAAAGVYSGEVDGWIGPRAENGVMQLIRAVPVEDGIQNEI